MAEALVPHLPPQISSRITLKSPVACTFPRAPALLGSFQFLSRTAASFSSEIPSPLMYLKE